MDATPVTVMDALEAVQPGPPKYRITEHHTHLARLVVCFGMTAVEIADECGLDVKTVRRLLKRPEVREEIARVGAEETVASKAHFMRVRSLVGEAIDIVEQVLHAPKAPAKEKVGAAKWIAARGGLPRVTRTESFEARVTLTGQQVSELRQMALNARREGRALEGVGVELTDVEATDMEAET